MGGATGVGGVAAAATHLVVAANTSVSLRCRVEAVPRAVTFTWRVGPPLPPRGLAGDLAAPPLQQAPVVGSGELPTQDTPEGAAAWEGPWREAWRQLEAGEGVATVEGRRDPQYPDASTLTLTPGASTVVGCFARNSAGHTRVPCRYTLTVVGQYTPLPFTTTSCYTSLPTPQRTPTLTHVGLNAFRSTDSHTASCSASTT